MVEKIRVECFGKNGNRINRCPCSMGWTHFFVHRSYVEEYITKQFQRSPDGFVKINDRYAYSLSGALMLTARL